MIHFACVQCCRRHKVDESMIGLTVKCPCGQLMIVPSNEPVEVESGEVHEAAVEAAEVDEPDVAEVVEIVEEKITVHCICGTELKVPTSAIGKMVRCKCGETMAVAGAAEPLIEVMTPRGDVYDPFLVATPKPPGASGGLPPQGWMPPGAPMMPPPLQPVYGQPAAPQPSRASRHPAGSKRSSFGAEHIRQAEEDAVNRRKDERAMASRALEPARWSLIVVGILTIIANIYMFFNAPYEAASVAQEAAARGEMIDKTLIEIICRVFYAIVVFVGFGFILLGLLVYQFPVAAPAIGLTFYGLGILFLLYLNPTEVLRPVGIMIKLAIIGTLVKAINDGAYYRR